MCEPGEIVGHSQGMIKEYLGQPEKTREVEWHDSTGQRFIRTSDIGRSDEDGFLILVDRKIDMIISGGFNVYSADLENELRKSETVNDVAVVAAPSEKWGETPVAFVVPTEGNSQSSKELLKWLNNQVGSTQRISDLHFIKDLPRNAIGKVLKRDLRNRLQVKAGN